MAAALIMALGLAACGTADPHRAPMTAAPDVTPIRTRTSFSDAQTCLDALMIRSRGGQVVSVGNFQDRTQSGASVGGREMIEAAVRNSARVSQAWTVRRYDFTPDAIGSLQSTVPLTIPGLRPAGGLPDYLVVGSVTQFDKGAESSSTGGSLIFGDVLGAGVQNNRQASVLGIDLQMFERLSGNLVAQTSNSIALLNTQTGTDARGRINKFGATFDMSFERQDGIGVAARTLIDLGVIELIGEASRVPYWECLSMPSTNPQVRQLVDRWWHELPRDRQLDYVRARLINLGYLEPGASSAGLGAAIARFEAAAGLVPDGRPDAQLYAALLNGSEWPSDSTAATAASPAAPTPATPPAPPPQETPQSGPLFTLSGGRNGSGALFFEAGVLRGGYMACYLQLQSGEVLQVYPNAYQPGRYLTPGKVRVPPASRPFEIRFDKGSTAPIVAMCAAAGRDVTPELPASLRSQPFAPIPGATLKTLAAAWKRAAPAALIQQIVWKP